MTRPFPIQPNDNRNPLQPITAEKWKQIVEAQSCSVCGKGNCRPANHSIFEIMELRLRA